MRNDDPLVAYYQAYAPYYDRHYAGQAADWVAEIRRLRALRQVEDEPGERGRVAIARALAARPELLLADEPTSRLDQANALAVGTLFVRLARELGTAVVCATHDPLLIEQADEVLKLG